MGAGRYLREKIPSVRLVNLNRMHPFMDSKD